MRLSAVATAFTAAALWLPSAVAEVVAAQANPVSPEFIPTPEKPFNFHIDYHIAFLEDTTTGFIDDVNNGETIELLYTFNSQEALDASIVGVGGELLDPVSGLTVANITASQIGPVPVTFNESVTFGQKIGINLDPATYLLVPAVYVVHNEQLMVLGGRNKLVNVVEPPISAFHPQLIIAELVLAATLAATAYAIYNVVAGRFLKTKKSTKSTKSTKTKKTATTTTPPPSSSSSSNDSAWLPATHARLRRN